MMRYSLDWWCKWFSLITLPVIALFLLSSCANAAPYWVLVYEPVAHTGTRIVDKPCGRSDWAGCSSRGTGIIQLWSGLTEAQRWCVLGHEKKHLAGYNHPGHSYGFAYDCGNGELL